MVLRVLFASVSLLCVSVAHAEEPQWLKEARAREGKTGAAHEFKSKDKWFTARVPGKVVGDIVKERDSYTVTINIGSESPTYCEVIPDGFDMADMLRRTVDITMKEVEKVQGKVEARQLEFTDAGAIGNVPFLESHWLYRVNDGKEARLGALKQMIFEKYGHGVYCAHLDLGYVKTFEAVARAMAESFEAPAAAPAPYFLEIATASLAGMKIGVAVTSMQRDADGDTKTEEVTAILLASPSGELHTQDALHMEWIRPDATLINATHVIAANGEVITNVALKADEQQWIVDGEMQGKKVKVKLPADAKPGTSVQQARALREILSGDKPVGAEYSIPMWLSADPGKLTPTNTKVLAQNGPNQFAATAVAGGFEAKLTMDKATGMANAADIPMGAQSVHMERVYLSGSF